MKNKAVVLAMMTMMIAPSVFAQGSSGAGNGGRVWVCFEPKDPRTGKRPIKSVELVDYVEARSLTTWKIDLGIDHPGVDDSNAMIELALTRLARVDFWRAAQVRKKLEEIKTRSASIDLNNKVALSKIDDATILIMPPDDEDCVERQGAFNKTDPGPMDFKYAFVKQYMEKMSDLDRAGLMLHEALYNLDAGTGAKKSDGSREMVRAVSSPMLDGFTAEFYYELAKRNTTHPTVTAAGVSYQNAVISENRPVMGTLLENHVFPTAALCSVNQKDCYDYRVEATRKVFALDVHAGVGDGVSFNFTAQGEEALAVSRGGKVKGPGVSASLDEILYANDSTLQLNSFEINQMLEGPEYSRHPIRVEKKIQVGYPSLQLLNNRIDLNQGYLVEGVEPKNGYTLIFSQKKSVHIDFQSLRRYKAYVTLAEDGHVSQLEIAPAYFSTGKVKMTDTEGQVYEQTLKDGMAFPNNAHLRRYWVIGFDADGKITHNEVVKRRENND
jgi:hypothetical protein